MLLWGFTAILGKVITIKAIPLVWYRLVIVVVVLAGLVPLRGHSLRVPVAAAKRYAFVGAMIGIHWLCFYGAVKVAGLPTAVLMLSTIAFFTAIVEPLVFGRKLDRRELVVGAIVVIGVALLIQVELAPSLLGFSLGLGSALFAALFGVWNGKLAHHEPPERLMLYELIAALVVVSLCFVVVPSQFVVPDAHDAIWLIVMGVLCTVVPQVFIIHVLRTLSPFTVAVSTNLEPVYALIVAAILFHDDKPLTVQFYVGAAVIIGLVIWNGTRRVSSTSAESVVAAHLE